MRDTALDIIGIQPLVVGQRGGELFHQPIGLLGKPAAPGFSFGQCTCGSLVDREDLRVRPAPGLDLAIMSWISSFSLRSNRQSKRIQTNKAFRILLSIDIVFLETWPYPADRASAEIFVPPRCSSLCRASPGPCPSHLAELHQGPPEASPVQAHTNIRSKSARHNAE